MIFLVFWTVIFGFRRVSGILEVGSNGSTFACSVAVSFRKLQTAVRLRIDSNVLRMLDYWIFNYSDSSGGDNLVTTVHGLLHILFCPQPKKLKYPLEFMQDFGCLSSLRVLSFSVGLSCVDIQVPYPTPREKRKSGHGTAHVYYAQQVPKPTMSIGLDALWWGILWTRFITVVLGKIDPSTLNDVTQASVAQNLRAIIFGMHIPCFATLR